MTYIIAAAAFLAILFGHPILAIIVSLALFGRPGRSRCHTPATPRP